MPHSCQTCTGSLLSLNFYESLILSIKSSKKKKKHTQKKLEDLVEKLPFSFTQRSPKVLLDFHETDSFFYICYSLSLFDLGKNMIN